MLEDLHRRRRAQFASPDVALEEGLILEQPPLIAVPYNVLRPIVRDAHIDRLAQLHQAEDVELANVVKGAHRVVTKDWHLMVAEPVVVLLEDAGEARDAQPANVDNARVAHVINIRRGPSAVEQLGEVRARLVVAANKYRQNRRDLLARIILVKILHRAVMHWARHARQIRRVATCLEVAADDYERDARAGALLGLRNRRIDRVERAVAAADDSDVHWWWMACARHATESPRRALCSGFVRPFHPIDAAWTGDDSEGHVAAAAAACAVLLLLLQNDHKNIGRRRREGQH